MLDEVDDRYGRVHAVCQVHLPIHASQEEVVVRGGIELDLFLLKLGEPGIVFIPSRPPGERDGGSVFAGLLEMKK